METETIQLYDSIARDEIITRATENEMEVQYLSAAESDNDSMYDGDAPRRKHARKSDPYNIKDSKMVIHLFGMTAEGKSVRADVIGFRPFFYISWPSSYVAIDDELRKRLGKENNLVDLLEFKSEMKQELFGYTGGKLKRFLRISMPSLRLFYRIRKEFLDEKQNPKFCLAKNPPIEVYEANIDPMLRFFHMRDIRPCGWITLNGEEMESANGIRVRCDWEDLSHTEAPMVAAPLIHAFWDVECYSHTGEFPQANPTKKPCKSGCLKGSKATKCSQCQANNGDPIIQIGTTLWSLPAKGATEGLLERHIFVLNGCTEVAGATVHSFTSEGKMILKWFDFMVQRNVNVFVGYNIFGFDERYVWDRLDKLGLTDDLSVQQLSHLYDEGKPMKLEEKRLSSSALGDNFLYMWQTPGRLRIDLLGHIRRKAQLPSYKLDSVAAVYLSGKLSGIARAGEQWLLKTKQKGDARVGRAVQVLDELGEDLTEKMSIAAITADGIVVSSDEDLSIIAGAAARWAVVKDDVSPQEIFKFHRGTDADRAVVAAYCVQDCDLTLELYKKLDVFNEAMSMANVCSVPVSYIFTRGQGIKIESLIFKDCMIKGQLIKVLPAAGSDAQDSYEGAIVLDPTPGFYETPVGVCDFASLYPSTMISENISHDMLVWAKDYIGDTVTVTYGSVEAEANAPPGTAWTDIEFDILRPDPEDTRKHPPKHKVGTRLCRYAQPATTIDAKGMPVDVKGSLPQIVAKLLAARKAKRVEITKTDDPFKKALLDAEQNAYKTTANSLYGQLGSPTFKIRLQNLAASVTAYGRKQIMFSKMAIEQFYGPAAGDPRCSAEIVYGDTDSIFVNYNPRGPDGQLLKGREAIVATIALTEETGKFITGALKAPHDFEYDKTFSPFIIFSKKRYVGNKYEESPDEFKETSMGIVLKRRDNAPLLKMTYSAAIDRLLNHQDVPGAVSVVHEKVRELVEGKMKLSQLTITKSLRAEYKGTPPAHKMLAMRIAERDPGNAPASGERIGYVYIQTPVGQVAAKLQGDRVETPAYIIEKGLKPDAEYYIHHQLMNPLSQLFGIMADKMPGFVEPAAATPEERIAQRERIACDLLFKQGLATCSSTAKREFMSKLGAINMLEKPKTQARAPATATAVAGPAPKKTQMKLTSVFKDMAFIEDQMLMNGMKAAVASRAKAKAAAKEAATKPVKETSP